MTIRIKGHFDGKTIVPDEPVDVPTGTVAVVEFAVSEENIPLPNRRDRRASLEQLFGSAVKRVGIPLESTRRENLYEDR